MAYSVVLGYGLNRQGGQKVMVHKVMVSLRLCLQVVIFSLTVHAEKKKSQLFHLSLYKVYL